MYGLQIRGDASVRSLMFDGQKKSEVIMAYHIVNLEYE